MRMNKKLSVDEVLRVVKGRGGSVTCNVLKYKKWRGVDACFEAARQGKLIKIRVSCAIFRFQLPENLEYPQ